MTDEVIYNLNCYSLFTDDVKSKECLKRVFYVKNINNDKTIKIMVCAEYFRLLYHKYSKEYQPFNMALDESISDFVPYWQMSNSHFYMRWSHSKSFENINLYINIMDRPYRSLNLSIIEAFNIILESNGNSQELKKIVFYELIKYITKGEQLKKDQKIYRLIKDSFQCNIKIKGGLMFVSSSYGINENSFLELISELIIKLK